MGKDTGFLEYGRKNNKDVPPEERIGNFDEFHKPLGAGERMEQETIGCRQRSLIPSCLRITGMLSSTAAPTVVKMHSGSIYWPL